METRSPGTPGSLHWLAQAGTGLLLVVLLGVHLIVNHWAAPQGLLSYSDIVRYYQVPGIAWMEVAFLIAVTSHCVLGLHSILLDLNLKPRLTVFATWFLAVFGLAAVGYGAWLIETVVTHSTP